MAVGDGDNVTVGARERVCPCKIRINLNSLTITFHHLYKLIAIQLCFIT